MHFRMMLEQPIVGVRLRFRASEAVVLHDRIYAMVSKLLSQIGSCRAEGDIPYPSIQTDRSHVVDVRTFKVALAKSHLQIEKTKTMH